MCGRREELTFEKTISYPQGEYANNLFGKASFVNDKTREIFDDILEQHGSELGESHHKLFGYPDLIQGEVFLEAQLVTNGLNCSDPPGCNDPRAKKLEKGVKDWILLFQIDTDDNAAVKNDPREFRKRYFFTLYPVELQGTNCASLDGI